MGHATEGFEVLGAAHGLGARGSVSGSGVQLGLDRTSDETRGWVHKAVVPVRTHRPRGAGGGCGGRAGDARGCLPQSGGLGTRESESVRPWHTPDSLDRGRDRKSTRLNSSHRTISYAVFCLKKKKRT